MSELIYLDNAATTKTDERVFEAMKTYFSEEYANPSGIYTFAQRAKAETENARKEIADVIGAKIDEIYFTAGGSESDNWALKATADELSKKGKHIITSKIEHHAILHTCEYLERHGFEITYLDVDDKGFVRPQDLKNAIREDTILISIMFANNEIGTIEPIAELAKIAHEKGVLFHTDAVQAFGHVPIDVNEMNIDMLSASGHKFNGPKGVGILYIRKGIKIGPLIHGGAQEHNRRAGTHNVPGIIGMGVAAKIASEEMDERAQKEIELRDYFIEKVLSEVEYVRLNGDKVKRLPNNINFSFDFIEGESLLIMLDQKGICASSGSACTSGSLDPSHVLLAIGLKHETAHGSLRITISQDTTRNQLDFVVTELKRIVERLRSMSPLYDDFIQKL